MNKKNKNLDFEKLASVIADLTTDGHIQLRKKSGVISYYSKDLDEIQRFNSLFESLFDKRGNVFKDIRQNNIRYKLFISNTKLARFLKLKGAPVGNKTNTIFNVPSWIFEGPKEIQKIYLRRLFDAEGSIFYCKDGRWRLFFNMNKNEKLMDNGIAYLNEIKSLLELFNIDSSPVRLSEGTLRKDLSKSKNMKLEIKKHSLLNFYNKLISLIQKKGINLSKR